ncbi:MAG: NAD-dependent epimerase/dehydratase family protein [Myxococcales bacterium]|nr:NAD-dependent epimerase/dehydratase family protein [Myxococcales bacterium]
MRVLVTGGAGFIGSNIVDALVDAGHEVRVLDNLATGKASNVRAGVKLEQVDLRDGASVDRVIAEFRPEAISHQAAQTSVAVSVREPVLDAEANVIGSIHLFEACVKHHVGRVVFASTGGAIYGEVADGQRAEVGWREDPLSPYACSKLAVERYMGFYRREHGLDGVVLRYANVYGPRQDPHGEAGVIAIFHQRLKAGQPIQINAKLEQGDDGCVRDYVFVSDVVRANVMALTGNLHGTVNVATGTETTTRQAADLIAAALKVDSPEIGFGGRRAGDLQRSVLLPAGELGECVSFADGIGMTAEWFSGES